MKILNTNDLFPIGVHWSPLELKILNAIDLSSHWSPLELKILDECWWSPLELMELVELVEFVPKKDLH